MRNKTIDIILIIFVSTMLVTLAFFVRLGETADKVAVLQAVGMICDGCVADIEMALQAKGGIASMEVDVRRGRVIVGYDSKKIRPDEIATTIAGLVYLYKDSEVLSIERFRAMTGREPGINMKTIGCTGVCGT